MYNLEIFEFIQWLLPYIILVIGLGIGGLITKTFIQNKYKYAITRAKAEDQKKGSLDSISGKLQFAIENTQLAYEKLNNEIKDAEKLKAQAGNNKMIIDQCDAKIKGAKQQLQVVEYIMKNRQLFDMGGELLVPIVAKLEKKFKGMVKGGLSGAL